MYDALSYAVPLQQAGFHGASVEWITQCLDYLTRTTDAPPSTIGLLQAAGLPFLPQIEDLLLHCGLETTCPQGTFGRELGAGPKDMVEARPDWSGCVLQLQAAVDISVPRYTPKIEEVLPLEGDNKDKDSDDEEEQQAPARGRGRGRGSRGGRGGARGGARPPDYTRKRRTLSLVFTDGRQQLQALEFDPLVELDGDLLPGMKFSLKPPVQVRRGVMLLTFGSIQRLGGFLPAPKDPAPPKPPGFSLAPSPVSFKSALAQTLPPPTSALSSPLPLFSAPQPPLSLASKASGSVTFPHSTSAAPAPNSLPQCSTVQRPPETIVLSLDPLEPLMPLPSFPVSSNPSKLIVLDDDEIEYDKYGYDDEIYLELTDT